MDAKGKMTRRSAIVAGAIAAASALTVAGCNQSTDTRAKRVEEPEQVEDTERAWLPLGSVVTCDFAGDLSDYMIVCRKPYSSTTLDRETGEEREARADDPPFDYGGVAWPLGVMSDLAELGFTAEVRQFDREAIAEVKHVGYVDEVEERASRLLEEGDAEKPWAPGTVLLLDLAHEVLR